MTSLAEALPDEIKRVQVVRSHYEELRNLPNVIVGPQIAMMTADIDEGVASLASGDVVRMIRAYEALKGWSE